MKQRYLLALYLLFAGLSVASVNVTVTYYCNVVPILQQHCLSCHEANSIASIAFQTYRQTRPWAELIEHMVLTRTMPPSWRDEGTWRARENHDRLTAREISIIVAWVEQGAVAGDPHDAPPPLYFDQARWAEPSPNSPLNGRPKTLSLAESR